jgi:hypothetical protein
VAQQSSEMILHTFNMGDPVKSLARHEYMLEKYEDLILTADSQLVFEEVSRIIKWICPYLDFTFLDRAFQDVVKLFQGEYPGYQGCNTGYHNLKHTMDCLLAMARLMHGASLNGLSLPERDTILGLIAALFHDSGYIQSDTDVLGTGAKYTLVHVERSLAFLEGYFSEMGFSASDLDYCQCCVQCTGWRQRSKRSSLNLLATRLWVVCWELQTSWDSWRIEPTWSGCPFFIGSSWKDRCRGLSPSWIC